MLISKLLGRGDKVRIDNGILKIEPMSGKKPPIDWLKKNEAELVKNIARLKNIYLYKYSDYGLGHTKGHSQSRLTLYFIEILTGRTVSMIFNVNRQRARSNKKGKKGDQLPRGRFSVGKRSKLYELWAALDLEMPRKPSEFNNKLSLLKGIYFNGVIEERSYGYKFKDKKIEPANIIIDDSLLVYCQEDANFALNRCQEAAKESCQGISSSPEWISDYSENNYVYSKVRTENKALRVAGKDNSTNMNRLSKKRPEDQSNSEWLDDYGEI